MRKRTNWHLEIYNKNTKNRNKTTKCQKNKASPPIMKKKKIRRK